MEFQPEVLNFSRRCLEEVRMMTSPRDSKSSEVINYEQCVYLVNSLDKAVDKASLFLKGHNRYYGGNSTEHFQILCMLAKKVKCFIQGCYKNHWLRTSVMLSNLSECTVSLDFDLKLFTVLLPPFNASPSTLSLDEVSNRTHVESELIKEMASRCEDRLVTKLRALIQRGQASSDDLGLAKFLLKRLDRLKRSLPSMTPGLPPPTLNERDLTNLKHMVQIASSSGGLTTVHKASFGIDVAVKTFQKTLEPVFKKEVPILAGLSHPNIVSFLCHGEDMGECYIVMELMDQDLFSLLKERLRSDRTRISPFSVFEEFDMMLQIAEAMDYLHKMRVLHRDLKSQNILVRCLKSANAEGYEYVQVKVSDFGLSRTKEVSVTQSNMTPNTGTSRWMAPELIEIQNVNDILDSKMTEDNALLENHPFKYDVYSFGMVCLEILTGDVPFSNMSAEVKRAICAGKRPQLPDRCHEKLKALIERCWNPVASSRPSFGDICTELRYLKSLHMTRKSQGSWITTFTIAELRSVTSNFAQNNFLGGGDFSVVYQGILQDGSKVAVKRVKGGITSLGLESTEPKIGGWMSARHPHLVQMLGYCIDGNDLLLVTEYMPQGTLAQRLLECQEKNPAKSFSWMRRLRIALGVAQALVHLDTVDSLFRHFNLKSSNVLLDDDFNAKVSGFGPWNCSVNGSLRQGVRAYGDVDEYSPESTRKSTWSGCRSEAAPVYSFGVVLMELLTGCPAVSKEQELVERFKKLEMLGSCRIDPHLDRGLNFHPDRARTMDSIRRVEDLAIKCTGDFSKFRPHMGQVVRCLRREEAGRWPDWCTQKE